MYFINISQMQTGNISIVRKISTRHVPLMWIQHSALHIYGKIFFCKDIMAFVSIFK